MCCGSEVVSGARRASTMTLAAMATTAVKVSATTRAAVSVRSVLARRAAELAKRERRKAVG
jgi:hypothetical protein